MLSERSCCASTGSVEPRRKRRADTAKHPRHTPAAAPWTPRNRTAAAVPTGLPPRPALLPATPSGAPCWAAAQTCPHPRAEIPRRCAAATTANSEPHASMVHRSRHPGSRLRLRGTGLGSIAARHPSPLPPLLAVPRAAWGSGPTPARGAAGKHRAGLKQRSGREAE
jgi:hypothetical protein